MSDAAHLRECRPDEGWCAEACPRYPMIEAAFRPPEFSCRADIGARLAFNSEKAGGGRIEVLCRRLIPSTEPLPTKPDPRLWQR